MKRALDVAVVLATAPFTLLLGLCVALAIRLDGSGPLLFHSERVGRGGDRFRMLKFRTMYPDGRGELRQEERAAFNQQFKLEKDPRVTPIGRWLRAWSLDELPQLLNVLRGEMSMVGPRPKLPEECHLFGDALPELLSVPPGMTGYWQVFRENANSDETMRSMDLYYIEHRSLRVDLRLLALTPRAMLARRNC